MSDQDNSKECRCISCGFAAKRARVVFFGHANREYFEIPFDERQQSLSLSTNLGGSAADTTDIACFRGKIDLASLVGDRMGELHGGSPEHVRERMHELISKQVLEEMGCDAWYKYEPGRTPQEHLNDFMWERLEEQRQRYEHDREVERQKFNTELSIKLETDRRAWITARDAERDLVKRENDTFIKRFTLIGSVMTAVQVVLALIAILLSMRTSAADRVFEQIERLFR